ncbi:hypothetical protein [Massilia aerilata]|uniref:Uncharacterized protein n=1 Tax=Massilia aerilata TaxID=453817 RepID=A0ABW0S603_9BURK
MTGPIAANQDQPLNPSTFKHQALLLKSMHCCRPVLHNGLKHYIQGLTSNVSGCDITMLVYLTGKPDGIDSSLIEIMTTPQQATEETHHA